MAARRGDAIYYMFFVINLNKFLGDKMAEIPEEESPV
jgi:hypothetical protein